MDRMRLSRRSVRPFLSADAPELCIQELVDYCETRRSLEASLNRSSARRFWLVKTPDFSSVSFFISEGWTGEQLRTTAPLKEPGERSQVAT